MKTRPSAILFCAIVSVFCCVLLFSHLRQVFSAPAASITQASRISGTPGYAVATFLSTRVENESDHDDYFTATRVLAYQLLHQPGTRTERGVPFLVLVPPHVSEQKRQVLREDGATVIPVELLSPQGWIARPMQDRWIDQFTKLRLWTLTEYSRILYMDSDMLVLRTLDDIWDEDTVSNPQKTRLNQSSVVLPAEYVISGVVDNERAGRKRPSPKTFASRLNGGFFVTKPDKDLFEYYVSVLETQSSRFDAKFMEMGLLNYVHREDGPMPWAALPLGRYSNNWPQLVDVENGSATLHDKFWLPGNQDWIERQLVEMWWRTVGRMEGYWERGGRRLEG